MSYNLCKSSLIVTLTLTHLYAEQTQLACSCGWEAQQKSLYQQNHSWSSSYGRNFLSLQPLLAIDFFILLFYYSLVCFHLIICVLVGNSLFSSFGNVVNDINLFQNGPKKLILFNIEGDTISNISSQLSFSGDWWWWSCEQWASETQGHEGSCFFINRLREISRFIHCLALARAKRLFQTIIWNFKRLINIFKVIFSLKVIQNAAQTDWKIASLFWSREWLMEGVWHCGLPSLSDTLNGTSANVGRRVLCSATALSAPSSQTGRRNFSVPQRRTERFYTWQFTKIRYRRMTYLLFPRPTYDYAIPYRKCHHYLAGKILSLMPWHFQYMLSRGIKCLV